MAILVQTITCEFSKELDAVVSFTVLKWQFPLLAGNCLPYHQPYSYSLRPTSVLELTWFSAHGCRESFQLVRLPGGPTTDHPWSLPASPEASDEDDVLRRCPLSEHSTILSVTPPAQQILGARSIGGLPFQVTSSVRPFQCVENCVDSCFVPTEVTLVLSRMVMLLRDLHYDFLGSSEGYCQVR